MLGNVPFWFQRIVCLLTWLSMKLVSQFPWWPSFSQVILILYIWLINPVFLLLFTRNKKKMKVLVHKIGVLWDVPLYSLTWILPLYSWTCFFVYFDFQKKANLMAVTSRLIWKHPSQKSLHAFAHIKNSSIAAHSSIKNHIFINYYAYSERPTFTLSIFLLRRKGCYPK